MDLSESAIGRNSLDWKKPSDFFRIDALRLGLYVGIFRRVGRYWRIYKTFFVSSFARELEFRANFFARAAQNLVWIIFFILILLVVYRNTDAVAGWTRGEAFILAATCFLMNALSTGFFMSITEIPQQVRMGTLDFVLTKPVDSQFWVSARRFNFNEAGVLVAGIVLIGLGVAQSGLSPSPVQWAAYAVLLGASLAIFYSFNLALMTLGVWLVRVDNLWVLGESIMQIARYPADIYQGILKRLFVYAVPLAFIATVPARQLVEGFNPAMVGLGIGWAAAFLILARLFWLYAMRHYNSASS
jgi:ABC-2 type transport system permease protein